MDSKELGYQLAGNIHGALKILKQGSFSQKAAQDFKSNLIISVELLLELLLKNDCIEISKKLSQELHTRLES
jgi:hypothetical protein